MVPCLYQTKSQPRYFLSCCHSQKPEAALDKEPSGADMANRGGRNKSRRKETGPVVGERQVSSPGHSGGQQQSGLVSVPCRAQPKASPRWGCPEWGRVTGLGIQPPRFHPWPSGGEGRDTGRALPPPGQAVQLLQLTIEVLGSGKWFHYLWS